MKFYCAILAGGQSIRFGSCKLNAEINGCSLLENTLRLGLDLRPEKLFLISGAWHEEIEHILKNTKLQKDKISLVYNDQWREGIASSIRSAVQITSAQKEALPLLILLADQVALNSRDISKLIILANDNPEKIVCTQHEEILGPPSIFPSTYFVDLMQCTGDTGAKKVIIEHMDNCIAIDTPNAAIDIDTPEDLKKL